MTVHYVKSWTHLFQAAKSGSKRHDFRNKNERDYKVGDYLVLEEFDYVEGKYTGQKLYTKITYKTDNMTPCALSSNGLNKDLVVLSFMIVDKSEVKGE